MDKPRQMTALAFLCDRELIDKITILEIKEST